MAGGLLGPWPRSESQHHSSTLIGISHTPITVNPRAVSRWLLAITAVLAVLSLVAAAYVLSLDRPIGLAAERIVGLVDLDAEANAPTFFSILLLASAGALLGVIARHRRANGEPGALQWAMLSILFIGLSFDEAASIHETMIGPFRRMFPDNRFVYFGWVIPGAVFVLIVGVLFFRFLLRLDSRTRTLFIAAGFIFVGGALGIEVVESYIASGQGEENWPYVIALTVQEVLEMVGVILFIYALLEHMRDLTSGLDLTWTNADAEPSV